MRDYEIVYIFRSTFSPEEVETKLERYHGILTDGGGGEISALVQWGRRQLAYPIDKQTNGHYVVAQFTARPERLAELERVLKLEDDLLRYLVVLSEGEMPLPEAIAPTPTPGAAPDGAAPATTDEKPEAKEAAAEGDAAGDDESAAATEAGDAETPETEASADGDAPAAGEDAEAETEDADSGDEEKEA
ncbi:MAG: 30S ribosomal protein S6 [Gemmatimonadetes bacterium]|nr:30S ribosomal protein S6 [Gemmatimonadota bacterium]